MIASTSYEHKYDQEKVEELRAAWRRSPVVMRVGWQVVGSVVAATVLVSCSWFGADPDWVGTTAPLTFEPNSCVDDRRSATRDDHGNLWRANEWLALTEPLAGTITYTSENAATFMTDGESIPLTRVEDRGKFPESTCDVESF